MIPQSIEELISRPETTLEELIADKSLPQAISKANKALVSFLSQPKVLESLVEWTLTPKKSKEDQFRQKSIICIDIFTTDFNGYLTNLVENGFFLTTLRNFINSEYSSDPMSAGHFQRIVECLGRLTNGKFIQDFKELGMYLFNNINNLALRELFIILVNDFKDSFCFSIDSVKYLCNNLESIANPFYLVSSFKILVKARPHNYVLFNDPTIIEHLLEIGVTTKDQMLANEVFTFMNGLKKVFPYVSDILKRFDGRYNFDTNNVTAGTASALALFPSGISAFINGFFDIPANTVLDGALVKSISLLDDEQLISLIQKHAIPAKIMENFGKSKTNGQITQLAEILANKGKICPSLDSKEWNEFIQTTLAKRVQLNSLPYGGELPHSCFSTFDDHAVYIDHEFDINDNEYNEEEAFSDGYSSEDYNYSSGDEYGEEPIEVGAATGIATNQPNETEEPAICRSFAHLPQNPNI